MFNPEYPTLKARIASGECLALAWLSFGSVPLVETARLARPDAIVIDMQHGLWERRDLEAAIGIVPHDIPVIVRVAENSALAIGTALDAGAEGVMVPMIETAADTARCLGYAKYPPHGFRSGGGVRPLQNFPAYVKGAEQLAVIVMIETAAGVVNAKSIAKVKGLDMVFIGTGDLGLSIGTWGGSQARHVQACADIKSACDAASLPCGVFTGSLESAVQHHALGYGMVVVSNDMDIVARGFAGASDGFRQAVAAAPRAGGKKPARKGAARLLPVQ